MLMPILTKCPNKKTSGRWIVKVEINMVQKDQRYLTKNNRKFSFDTYKKNTKSQQAIILRMM